MEKASAKLESIKMVKEWSVWLVTLQSVACAALWQPLTQHNIEHSLGYFLLLLGWLTFCLSIITATVLLGLLPGVVETLTNEDSDLYENQIFTFPLFRKVTIGHFMFVEHALLVIGILFIFVFVLIREAKGSDAKTVGVLNQQLQEPADNTALPHPFPQHDGIVGSDTGTDNLSPGEVHQKTLQPRNSLKIPVTPRRNEPEPSKDLPPLNIPLTNEQGRELFIGYIHPLFQKSCMVCHNTQSKASGLDLSSREGLLRGGSRGPAIIAGHAESSLLYKFVTHEQNPGMPFGSDKLPQETIARISQWIDSCAPFEKPQYPTTEIKLSGLFYTFTDGYLLFVPEEAMSFDKVPKKVLHDYEKDFVNPPPYEISVEVRIKIPENLLGIVDKLNARPEVTIIGRWTEGLSRQANSCEPWLVAEKIIVHGNQ